MEAAIKDKKEIAEETLWVKFDLLGKKIDFKPGQFFFITLINPPYKDIRGNERHFSFINSPKENDVVEMATRIRKSAFKRSLSAMSIKRKVEIGTIGGSFILPENAEKPLVFITGGIGITPFMSMLRFIREEKSPRKITLIYSNRNSGSAAFLQELQEIEKENSNFKLILIMTEDPARQEEKWIVDSEFIKKYIPEPVDNIYMLAGPPQMVKTMEKTLTAIGIKKRDIKQENFFGY